MSSIPSRPDVVVIGAGAAGIAAGRDLQRHGIPHLLLEARERIGGRAWAMPSAVGVPLDLGCEWLHSADRNVLATLAPDLGFRLDTTEPPWRRRHAQVGFDDADQDAFEAEQTAYEARLEAAAAIAERDGGDAAASTLLDPDARWNGMLDAISTYYNGAPLDRVSLVDYGRYVDTDVNWRVEGGYGAMIAALAAGLPIRTGCQVIRVDATGPTIRVETKSGTIETDKVIVTVPTGVLASGAIRFDPALDDHMQAAADLPLGLADKVYLRLDDPRGIEPDSRLFGAPGRADSGTYTLRKGGAALVEGYFGGDYARHLEAGGLAAFADAARREIAAGLGRDIGDRLTPLVATGWAQDPLALGSYSHARPGRADARAMLATPVDGRIAFAGEATSRHFFSTAHGAFEEGGRAVAALLARAPVRAIRASR